jgi:hypothetical protein
MMFQWVYWNLLMKGLELPLEPQMNIAGKIRNAASVTGKGNQTGLRRSFRINQRIECS